MANSIDNTSETDSGLFSGISRFVEEAQCGKLGFAVVCVNMIATGVFVANLAVFGGALLGAMSLSCSAVILPSIALFGPSNYFYYLPQPLRMMLGFAIAYATVKVDNNGAWQGKYADWGHFNDPRLAQGLEKIFRGKNFQSIIDCGCGNGFYVKYLLDKLKDVKIEGCDANADTQKLGDNFSVKDLTNPKCFGENKYDCVMSLEVAEHIPPNGTNVKAFLDNLTSAVAEDGWLILSWAKPGQGGLGHVNEQGEKYVREEMQQRGWTLQEGETEWLRLQTSPHTFWFRETLYVFKKTQN